MAKTTSTILLFSLLVLGLLLFGCTQPAAPAGGEAAQAPAVEAVNSSASGENQPNLLAGCEGLPDKLDLCQSFTCEFIHPFDGEPKERKVIGTANGKCQYTEEMPNNGRMDCEYTEDMKRAVAQYYRDVAAAETVGTSANIDIASGESQTTYTIDGKEVENPLQEAMSTGACVISGYS